MANFKYVPLTLWSCIWVFVFVGDIYSQLRCIDENGDNVNWYIVYKMPKLKDYDGPNERKGVAYAYITSKNTVAEWTLSDNVITSPQSMVGQTLTLLYENQKEYTYLMYNDEHSRAKKTSVGHTKGVVAFGETTGYWIIHSVPNFPPKHNYSYPRSGTDYGQIMLCMTFETKALNEIGKLLIFNAPSIYGKHLSLENLDDDVMSLFTKKPHQITQKPFYHIEKIKSKDGQLFTFFAKDNQFHDDLYDEIIAPTLETSLLVETWRRGTGGKLDSECQSSTKVINVKSISLKTKNRIDENLAFSTMSDHSKWAISTNSTKGWICISDINRMKSQYKRGGGAACFVSPKVWKAFDSSIDSTEDCKI